MHLKSLHDNTVNRLDDLTLKRLDSILEMTTRCISVHADSQQYIAAARSIAPRCRLPHYTPQTFAVEWQVRRPRQRDCFEGERCGCRVVTSFWNGGRALLLGCRLLSRMSGQRMRHLENPWSPCWAVATCDLVLAARYTMVPILSYSSVLSDMWGLRMLFSILVSWKCVLFSSRPRCIS